MHRDIRDWTKTCTACQKSKVYRHTVTPTGAFSLPNSRFDTVHIDLVGPLPPARGCRYLLTCVDRFSRWPEAIPITDTVASTVAGAFVSHWIARFGVPLTVTADRGAQFESQLLTSLLKFLSSTRIRTTSYHPCANSLVERFHRQLKAALYAQANPLNWLQNLPLVLLGIRSALKPDIGGSAAEVVYGCGLHLPGEFLAPTTGSTLASPGDLVTRLHQFVQQLRPVPPRTSSSPRVFAPDALATCNHVFLHYDAIRKPLTTPYDGPYRVFSPSDKTMKIDIKGKSVMVSMDRVKPAFLEADLPAVPDPQPISPVSLLRTAVFLSLPRPFQRVHWGPDCWLFFSCSSFYNLSSFLTSYSNFSSFQSPITCTSIKSFYFRCYIRYFHPVFLAALWFFFFFFLKEGVL